MKKFTFSMMGFLLAALPGLNPAKADHLSERITFSARMQPAPGVVSNGNGVAAFMLNSTHDTMYFTTSVAKLSSALTGFHIHNGRTGGNVIIDFDGKIDRNTVRSFITGAQLLTLMPDFMEGNLYIAAHTTNNPAVEILGSIKLETDWGFEASLSSSLSAALGHASIQFGMAGDTAIVRVATNMSSKITAAHIHFGKEGQNGTVALGFNSLIQPDSASLLGGVSVSASQWAEIVNALMADSIYINLHTPAFPGGEIRGQVRSTKTLRFDAWLNQAAEFAGGSNPPVTSFAYGVSTMWLNNTMDTLRYEVFFTDLTSTLTGAHFHSAPATGSGGVVKPLVSSSPNSIKGVWTRYDASNPLTTSLIDQLLMGNLYLNIHTSNNTGGEIRGQVYRFAREGFIAELNGQQAGVTTVGQGTVVASYDRDRTNLHTMMAFDNLNSTPTATHIHLGMRGQNGPVVVDLNPIVNNGSYKFSKFGDGFSEGVAISMRRVDSTYINVHTSAHTSGEIRGQLMRYYRISSQSVGMEEKLNSGSSNLNGMKLYPNPFNDKISVSFDAAISSPVTIRIFDLNGRMVFTDRGHSGGEISFSIPELRKGFYMAEVQVAGEPATFVKLLKD